MESYILSSRSKWPTTCTWSKKLQYSLMIFLKYFTFSLLWLAFGAVQYFAHVFVGSQTIPDQLNSRCSRWGSLCGSPSFGHISTYFIYYILWALDDSLVFSCYFIRIYYFFLILIFKLLVLWMQVLKNFVPLVWYNYVSKMLLFWTSLKVT